MGKYTARTSWRRSPDEAFTDNRYNRRHLLQFDGGAAWPASSSVLSVPLPYSDPGAVDPEELLVASLSSCHMLWFLSIAARRGFTVDDYVDDAEGTLAKDEHGRMAMTQVLLRPHVAFAGERQPDRATLDALHHAAHEACFIANSVRAEVRCEPRWN